MPPAVMMRSILILFVLFICAITALNAQDFSNKGKDFWLLFPPHQPSGPPSSASFADLSVYLTSDKNSSGKIEYNGNIQTFTVTANKTSEVILNRTLSYISGSESADFTNQQKIINNRGIKITVDLGQPAIVVYAHMFAGARSAASLILPTAVLGKTYYAMSWNQSTTSLQNGEFARSQYSVIATEDNTSIRINLKRNGVNAQAPILVDLPKAGDIYQFQDIFDITGTFIESIGTGANSCKKIAVFSGSSALGIFSSSNNGTCGTSQDPLFQQCYPINSWGKKYGITPFRGKNKLNYRILASEDLTTILTNGAGALILNKGEVFTGFSDLNSNDDFKSPLIIEADKPISVAQFSLTQNCDIPVGDPDMILLNPIEQSISDITVFLSSKQAITDQNINVFIKNAGTAIGSFKINGVPVPEFSFIAIGTSGYSYLQQSFSVSGGESSSIRLTSDSGFNAICYGFGSFESYAYSAGTNIIDLNPPITLKNEFSSTSVSYSATCTNTSFKVILSLTYKPNKIVIDMGGGALLTGPQTITYNPSSIGFDSTYISNGKNYYQYRLSQFYSFSTNGTFSVKITTTSDLPQLDGCSNTNGQEYTNNIVVNDPPIANFTIASNGCANNPILFTDISDGLGRPIVKWNWEYSDATTSMLQNPNKIFLTAGNYTAKLTSITDYGCVAIVTKDIKLSNKPVAGFTVPAIICTNSSISFTDVSTIIAGISGNIISQWRWNLDNGVGIIAVNANINQINTYADFGLKNVYLVTESNTGCISDTFRIPGFKINPIPEVGFILPEVCLEDAFATFTDTSKIADGTKALLKYLWKFDDGVSTIDPLKRPVPLSSTLPNPSPGYKSVGDYLVSLELISNHGCAATLSKPFKVNGSIPSPSFEVQQIKPLCSNDSIRIINTSTVNFGTVTRLDIFWDTLNKPADKVPDENPFVNKQYGIKYANFSLPDSIPFAISLVAFSGNSSVCSRSIKKIIYVKNSPSVVFSDIRDICFDAAPRQLNQGSFSSALTAVGNYYGKGISESGLLNPVTTGVGNDSLKYLVVNSVGCRDSAFQPLTVWPSPIAKWGVSNPLCEKNNIPFTDSSLANFSNITQYKWDFGDENTEDRQSAAVFTHKYDTAKNYTVSLTVITDSGCISKANTQSLVTKDLPKPAFSLPIICLPDGRGSFSNQSSIADESQDLFRYAWNFGNPNDPSSSLLKAPTHKYQALGPYNVQLKITSKDGCIDSLTKLLNTIYPWPKADFTISAAEICLGDSIRFTDMGDGISSPPKSWRWNFGNGKLSELKNPANTFADSGVHNIKYFFFNDQGCVSDTVAKTVVVHPYPKLVLGPKISVLEGSATFIKPQFKYGTALTYLWTPSTYLNSVTDSIPKTAPLSDITYRLSLTGIGGCTVTDTLFIKLLLMPVVPNAFSPNGDGINDHWRIQNLESYPGATLQVFNRYGQLVFSSFEYSVDWDGKINGKSLPIGTYYYIIDPKNGRNKIAGSITIIF